MKELAWLQLSVYFGVLLALSPLPGDWMARIYAGEKHLLQRSLGLWEPELSLACITI
jgi:K+-transporting ATPase A subunit